MEFYELIEKIIDAIPSGYENIKKMLNNLSVFIRYSGGAGNSQRFLRYPLCRRLLLPTDRMGTLRYCQYFVLSC